jgi:hypothetical protein
MQKGYPSSSVGVVFNGGNLRRNSVLITLEIDDPIKAFVAATAMTDSNVPLIVATSRSLQGHQERLMGLFSGDFLKRGVCLESLT